MALLNQFSFILFLLSLIICLCVCQEAKFTDCGSGNVKSVKLIPCDEPTQCNLLVGSNVEVQIEFASNIDSDQVSELIKGIVRGKELPFPGEKKDPCSGLLQPGCPVKKDETYTFKAKFEIKQFYPAIPIEIKYSLLDKSENLIICVKVGAILVSTNKKAPRRG